MNENDTEKVDETAPLATSTSEGSDGDAGGGPLTIRVPPRSSSFHSHNGDPTATPGAKSPAEQVRFLLAPDTQAENLDLDVHALFCQMDVLCHFEDGETGWKEAARWLKYEEKVEAGNRWSKPHVPTASLHALSNIRETIEECTLMLDIKGKQNHLYPVAELIARGIKDHLNLSDSVEETILDTLLKPHKHRHRKAQKPGDTSMVSNANTTVTSSPDDTDTPINTSTPRKDKSKDDNENEKVDSPTTKLPRRGSILPQLKIERLPTAPSGKDLSSLYHKYPGGVLPEDLMPYKPNKKLMGKIPAGSEAANILIGQLESISKPIMAFIRLAQPMILADLTEVAIPTRFIFLYLSPTYGTEYSIWECTEIGRAMATLLTDRVFCEVAYKASGRSDLINGIDEFLDDLTVLPPSIWDPSTRLEPPEKTISQDKIRKRLLDSARHAAGEEAFHFAESAGQDKSLVRTGRLFGGLVNDIKSRYKHYLSDFTDGLHIQCLASTIFLYFACITPIVTFGGLLGDATDGNMGTIETMFSGAICGILYALFAGQPLVIVGATGPLLVFESILYYFCKDYHLTFLPFRFWIGVWVALFLLIIVAFDLSALVRYITRFTEESFAVLISLIFMVESFVKLIAIHDDYPIHVHAGIEKVEYKCHCEHPPEIDNATIQQIITTVASPSGGNMSDQMDQVIQDHPIFEVLNWSSLVYEDCITYQSRLVVSQSCISEKDCLDHEWTLVGPACNVYSVTHSVPDVFFLCCFLFIGTFVIAYFFRMFRTSPFFTSLLRSTVSDFAVLIAVIICTSLDAWLGLDTPKLTVPDEIKCTNGRNWLVNPLAINQWWIPLAACLPALLATILIFLDQQITAVIINRKENKLKKGHGYHLDLLVLSVMITICSTFGLPWFVAATVRAVTHVRSLIRESALRVPGERPQFLGVREQRLTALCIHIFIGVSVLLTGILKHIPMAVLYGVFLYMGVTSLSGVQFVQRIMIMFMPVKSQPDYIYLRHMQTHRVYLFTFIQLFGMIVMWLFKSFKQVSILFPLMILALCFIRKGMDYVFTQSELYWIDHILPEEHRRKKEDGELDETDDEEIEKGKESNLKSIPLTKLNDDLPLKDEWDRLVAKRDYGVGRRARVRKESQNVIKRYRRERKGCEPYEEVSEEEELSTNERPRGGAYSDSFRDRKFSI